MFYLVGGGLVTWFYSQYGVGATAIWFLVFLGVLVHYLLRIMIPTLKLANDWQASIHIWQKRALMSAVYYMIHVIAMLAANASLIFPSLAMGGSTPAILVNQESPRQLFDISIDVDRLELEERVGRMPDARVEANSRTLREFAEVALDGLKQLQREDGSIAGDIVFNDWPTAAYLIASKMIPEWEDPDVATKMLDYLCEHQQSEGWYGQYPNNELPSQSVTLAAAYALDLWGREECARKAWEWLDRQTAEEPGDAFTYILLMPMTKELSTRISFLPSIELAWLFGGSYIKELPPWASFGFIGSLLLKEELLYGDPGNNVPKRLAMKWARDIMVHNQLEDGAWFGAFHATIYEAMALHYYGKIFDDQEATFASEKAWAFIKDNLQYPSGAITRFQLPVWDTGLSVLAMITAINSHTLARETVDPVMIPAVRYLIGAQQPDGGWAFSSTKGHPADSDDTAIAVVALTLFANTYGEHERRLAAQARDAAGRGLQFLIAHQNKDGGWAAYAVNQGSKPKGAIPSIYVDPMWTARDVSVADVTAHALLAFAVNGYTLDDIVVARGIRFLREDQAREGYWYGRWGQTFIYGTSAVLEALAALDVPRTDPMVNKALKWLLSVRNPSYAWGENPASYFEGYFITAEDTLEHTSWALSALAEYEVVEGQDIGMLLRVARETDMTPSIASAAFDVYLNTAYPYHFGLIAASKLAAALEGEQQPWRK